jgi:hypothetical protein
MKLFLFALFLFPGLAQQYPITFGFSGTSDQMTLQSISPPAPSALYLIDALGNPIALVNLLDYGGQALNTGNLPHWLGDEFLITGQLTTTVPAIPEPPVWLMLGAGLTL